MYVYTYIRMYVCVYVSPLFVCMYVDILIHTYVYTYVCMYIRMYVSPLFVPSSGTHTNRHKPNRDFWLDAPLVMHIECFFCIDLFFGFCLKKKVTLAR